MQGHLNKNVKSKIKFEVSLTYWINSKNKEKTSFLDLENVKRKCSKYLTQLKTDDGRENSNINGYYWIIVSNKRAACEGLKTFNTVNLRGQRIFQY